MQIEFAETQIPVYVLGFSDAAAMLFGMLVVVWAVNRAYVWITKIDRENRRQRYQDSIEKMHREHWKTLAKSSKSRGGQ